ncbi:hypothetical protein ASPBRDRAFT_55643 [Aspergillus brasiliensis CBS 101740]|uniref:Uncharacterized protein n=1 Tax=Aspergillus brasiliensis (strain CBS 101740 / IMI 381727 / IBT 21946) TaxID=767769 RepID=A0A1L9UH72_ASPBC|nr:hypothetical protein ASPBRDRAFT_55643 [Aspergillus brasiliensis CBS 101740]
MPSTILSGHILARSISPPDSDWPVRSLAKTRLILAVRTEKVKNFSQPLSIMTGQEFAVSNHPSPHRRRNGKSGPRSLVWPALNYSADGKGHGLWDPVEKGRAQAGWQWVFLSVKRRRILSPVGAGISEVAEPPATIEGVDLLTDGGRASIGGFHKLNGILPDGLHNINALSSDGGSCSVMALST